jgi:hypothetical protein
MHSITTRAYYIDLQVLAALVEPNGHSWGYREFLNWAWFKKWPFRVTPARQNELSIDDDMDP